MPAGVLRAAVEACALAAVGAATAALTTAAALKKWRRLESPDRFSSDILDSFHHYPMKIHRRILFQDLSLTTVGNNRRHAVLAL